MSKQIKVGIFVLVGLILITIAVFMIGDNKQLWDSKMSFATSFKDVVGLKPGAPVRLGGLDIGSVSAVGHGTGAEDTRIYVKVSVVKSEAVRIREGTKARIVNKGLLGDKMVELSVGNPSAPAIPQGGQLEGVEPDDFMAKFNELSQKASNTLDNLENATKPLGDPKFAEDLKASMSNLRAITEGIARNDSPAHRLLMDPNEGAKMDRVLNDLDNAASEFNLAMIDVRDVTDHVKAGPGILHAVVYDGDMSKSATGTLEELHADLKAIREGNGLAHEVIYGDDKTAHVMGNLNGMTDDLRAIVANMRAGKGTIGALLVDPSIYEDLKSAVGNVERNQVLRALVRYSIKADEAKPH